MSRKSSARYAFGAFLVSVTTWFLYLCQQALVRQEHGRYVRPYGIVFVVPIAMLTALGGVRAGVATLALSALALEYVLFAPHFSWQVSHPRDWAELGLLLAVGSLVIYTVEAARRNPQLSAEAREARARMETSERRRLDFNREVLLAVTGGRLLLCDRAELRDLARGEPALTHTLHEAGDASVFRHALRALVIEQGLAEAIRMDDLLTSVTEAATNAVKHGQAGEARVWLGGSEVSVLISDRGTGILPSDLARATLQHGYSSQATLGMGYALILQMADLVALATSEDGTDVLLRVGGVVPASAEEQFLDRFTLRLAA